MIKIRVNENKCCEIECVGSFFDIAAELSYAINDIYHSIIVHIANCNLFIC